MAGSARTMRVKQAQEGLRAELADFTDDDFAALAVRHEPAYWLRTNVAQQAAHARLIRAAEVKEAAFATVIATDDFKDVTEITLFSRRYDNLLTFIAGACAAAGANIVGAHIATTRDGCALDTIHLQRAFDRSEDEERRAKRIVSLIEALVKEEDNLEDVLAVKSKTKERLKAFTVEPQVMIDNTLSDEHTVVEVNGLDRPGLLYELTRELSDMRMDITSAHIATFGEKAVDVFYMTDQASKKITNASKQTAIRHRLGDVLANKRGSG